MRAALALYNCPQACGRVVNVASGQEVSMLELKAKIEHILGRPIPTRWDNARPGDVRRHLADITLLESLIDFKPQVTLDEGLVKTVEFYRERAHVLQIGG